MTAPMIDGANTPAADFPMFLPGGIDLATADSRYLRKNLAQVAAGDYLQIGGGIPATAGTIRFPQAGSVMWRNQADTGNIGIRIKAGNILATDAGSNYPTQIDLFSSAGTGLSVVAGGAVVIGVDPGGAELLRVGGSISLGILDFIHWAAGSKIRATADGMLDLYNSAGSDFNRVRIGGTTSAFPAIKRNGATLQARVADDTAYAMWKLAIAGLNAAASAGDAGEVVLGNATQATVGAAGGASALPATPSGYLKFYIGGTQYVLPYYAQA